MNLVVVAPHFAPDLAPTGEIITRIVHELAERSHSIEVITAYPWYRDHRIEAPWGGRLVRHEDTPWGRITRVHPFPTGDKLSLVKRAAGFAGFSALAALLGAKGARADGVLALSPPLTLGLTGWTVARARSCPFVFTIHDVYPDVAVELGVLSDKRLIGLARILESFCYDRADAVTVLSDELRANVARKTKSPGKVRTIPNFVDTDWIVPAPRANAYRQEFGLDDKTVVMYAGNVGLSQSLDLLIEAAGALAHEPHLAFVINGQGAARPELERRARGLANVKFVDMQPAARLPEVLAAADIHVVPLKRGLARSSVPSKTYSILASGRALLASVDTDSEVTRIVHRSQGGVAVPPEDAEAFTKALQSMLDSPDETRRMGQGGRAYAERAASPAAVAAAYEALFQELGDLRE
ncbi:MAG: glycosyltransferase family 4 protein [Actinobacteria bacterium]|nr:glycosyltransferase family 4 protein [Actinomycetota bacterium]